MHGWRRGRQISNEQWAINGPVLEDYIDFASYNLWVPASSWRNATGSSTVLSQSNSQAVRIFPDGSTQTVVWQMRRPRMWQDGRCSVRLWYSGTAVSSTAARVTVGIATSQESAALSTPSGVAALLDTPPTTGYLVISRDYEVLDTGGANQSIDMTGDLVTFEISRTGAHADDDYTDEWEFIGAEIFYKEATSRSQVRSSPGSSRTGERWLSKK